MRKFAFGVAVLVSVGCGSAHTSDIDDAGAGASDAASGSDAEERDAIIANADANEVPGEGDTCATAIPIGAGTRPGDSTFGYNADYVSDGSCSGLNGADRVYAVTVPAGQSIVASVTPEATFDASISLIVGGPSSCASSEVACTRSADGGGDGETDSVQYNNATGEAVQALLIVSTFWPAQTGTYSLSVDFRTAAAGEDCAVATPISVGTLLGQSTVGLGNDFEANSDECGALGEGPERVYAITVPARQRLVVHATPDPDSHYDLSLYLVQGAAAVCDAGAGCVSRVDDGSEGTAETTSFYNSGDAPTDLFIVVDGPLSDDAGAFSLDTSFSDPVEGDMCGSALEITPGTLLGQSFEGFSNDYDGGGSCASGEGPDRVYALDVPPGRTLSATVTPEASLDVSVSIVGSLDACDGGEHTCSTYSDSGLSGDVESLRYVNVTADTRHVYLIVDAYDGSGSFMVSTAIEE